MNDIKGIIEDVEKSDLVSDKVIKRVIDIIGQEKWQDIHDEESDICTTTGELIITIKGIVELEQKLEQTEKDLSDYQFNYPTIKALQKENAELKKKAENLQKYLDTQNCYRECAEVWGNLDKAKSLLAKWVELYKPKLKDFPKPPIQVDTEQFLKE